MKPKCILTVDDEEPPPSHFNGVRACLRKPFDLERLAEIAALVVGTGVHYIGEG